MLNNVHLYQHGQRQQKGRFAADRKTLDPDGTLLKRYDAPLEMRLADDGGYSAWTETPPGVVFGIAARDDDFNNYWAYVAEEPPTGEVGEDERWRHITDPELSPDW